MMKRFLLALLLIASPLVAAEEGKLAIAVEPLGDSAEGVVVRTTFRFTIPSDIMPGIPLVIIGSVTQNGTVTKRFRIPLPESQRESLTSIQTLQPGDAEIEARLMVPLEEQSPVIVAKNTQKFTIAKTGKTYVANENAGAEAILAEGAVPESSGAVKIAPPRRDVALNLFIVNVDVKPPVHRVEFWVEGKKILAKNAPPYRAELDLGKLPKRVEVRAVGYDDHGRYVDEDAFVVNEREMPLDAKLIRTVTPDGVSHVKVSIQNAKGTDLKSVTLFAGKNKIYEWSQPPYAINLPAAKLQGVDFLRVSAIDSTGYEAADILFLNGERYGEEIEVNLVELPVTVTDANGAAITNLKQSDFQVLENGKPQKITSFNFATNLPISVGVLIDHSGSMKPRMAATKKAAAEFFKRIMRPGDRAFVGGFAFDIEKQVPFVDNMNALEEQVKLVPDAEGGTALYDAMVTGLYRFRTLQGRRALIVLTDGEDTTSRTSYDDMLTYARAARVPLYFIGIALGISDFSGKAKMNELAAETGGVAYYIHDVKDLDATYRQLENDLRSQYLIAYNTESSKKDTAYRPVEVKVNKPGAKVRTIRGFIP